MAESTLIKKPLKHIDWRRKAQGRVTLNSNFNIEKNFRDEYFVCILDFILLGLLRLSKIWKLKQYWQHNHHFQASSHIDCIKVQPTGRDTKAHTRANFTYKYQQWIMLSFWCHQSFQIYLYYTSFILITIRGQVLRHLW